MVRSLDWVTRFWNVRWLAYVPLMLSPTTAIFLGANPQGAISTCPSLLDYF